MSRGRAKEPHWSDRHQQQSVRPFFQRRHKPARRTWGGTGRAPFGRRLDAFFLRTCAAWPNFERHGFNRRL